MILKKLLQSITPLFDNPGGERLLNGIVRAVEYGQGIGAGHETSFDRAVLKFLKKAPGPLCIFDGGANRGSFIELAKDELAGRQLKLHAFEPSSTAYAELEKRYGQASDVVLNRLALGESAGEATLYYDEPGSELASFYQRDLSRYGKKMQGSELVQITTIDDYCRQNAVERIDLLKLDVEGHELAVFKGAAKMLADAAIGVVRFEFGGCNIDSRTFLHDFYRLFKSENMRLARLSARGRVHAIENYDEALERFRNTCFVAYRD